ncbi:MAG TPA: class I SAM-dependent methyltransferase, partial [Kofleriaceae bacterium]|nr:class I SAM-dependent methyltransferase [Kofleriaceae bacterium]
MDVFGRAMQSRGFLCDAALAAAHELGVFDALAGGPAELGELAAALGVPAGQRLRALLEVLAAVGAIERQPGADAAAAGLVSGAAVGATAGARWAGAAARFAAGARVPPRPVIAAAGWGLLAEVIRDDRPLAAAGAVGHAEAERRYHLHLVEAGAAAAAELAGSLDARSLLDLGAGAGAYSKAFLLAQPDARVTLVDAPGVLGLAAAWLGPLAARARFVEGDACVVAAGEGHDAALLANVLHLHSPDMCARLCAAAARG